MHGRLKVRTTEEQEKVKKLEQEKKLKIYKVCTEKIFTKKENKEYDEEALSLTKEILQRNPEFYTLWNFRREALLYLKLNKSEEEIQEIGLGELNLTEVCLRKSPKSYNTWEHRLWSMEYMPKPDWDKELNLCKAFFHVDERNFHCWDYRRQVVKKCLVKEIDELSLTTDLISTNFSNYSAWHYRSKLLPVVHPGPFPGNVDEEVMLKEYEIVQNAAFTDPNDQSVWFYHRWLLGRSTESAKLISFTVIPKDKIIIVLFSRPVCVEKHDLKLLLNQEKLDTIWLPIADEINACRLWHCKMDFYVIGEFAEIIIEASYGNTVSSLCCNLNGYHCVTAQSSQYIGNLFSADISASTKDVLQKELESCEQLYELEPENKWTLFTSVLLMRALDNQKYNSTVSNYLKKLMDIDKMRKNYYYDLNSKFTIENYIRNMNKDATEICLVKNDLTTLHDFEIFYNIQKVDLSLNNLLSIHPLSYLFCVQVLILDGNRVEDCTNLKNLHCLQQLSLKNNCIKSLCSLNSLTSCKLLWKIFLGGNPVTKMPNFESEVKDVLTAISVDVDTL